MKKFFLAVCLLLLLNLFALAQSSHFEAGIKAANIGDFQTALSFFQKSFEKNLSQQKISQIHYNLGVCFYRMNQAEEAVREFEKAISLYPKYAKALYGLGMAETELNRYVKAESAFRQSLKFSASGEAWFDLAIVLFKENKLFESFQGFQNAIRCGSSALGASHNNLGVIFAMLGNFEAAEKEMQKAKTFGFVWAEKNLQLLRRAKDNREMDLVAKLISKESKDE